MRSILRTDPILRDVTALCAAAVVVGLSFGAIASAAGIPLSQILVMNAFVYAGGAQFLAVGLTGAGATALAIVVAGLLLNARHLPFGLAIGNEVLGERRSARLLGSHLMTDESVAFALAQPDPARRRRAYWLTGICLYLTWNVAALLALTLPSLKDRPSVRVAIAGAALALAATPFLPAGLPVLAALLALTLGRRAK
jgi:predicted branched-subunit amino acid permease